MRRPGGSRLTMCVDVLYRCRSAHRSSLQVLTVLARYRSPVWRHERKAGQERLQLPANLMAGEGTSWTRATVLDTTSVIGPQGRDREVSRGEDERNYEIV